MLLATIGGMIFLSWAVRKLGEYARRKFLNTKRGQLLQEGFPDFCYQPIAAPQDLVGLANFPHFADEFESFMKS